MIALLFFITGAIGPTFAADRAPGFSVAESEISISGDCARAWTIYCEADPMDDLDADEAAWAAGLAGKSADQCAEKILKFEAYNKAIDSRNASR